MTLEEKENEVRAKLQGLARQIKAQLPEGFGFVLLCASFGGGGATLYVANVQRLDALQLMREFIAVNQGDDRAFAKEMPELATDAAFEAFWRAQQERGIDPADPKRNASDAFLAGISCALGLIRNVPHGTGKTKK